MDDTTFTEIQRRVARWRKLLTGYEDKGPLSLADVVSEEDDWLDNTITIGELEGLVARTLAAESRVERLEEALRRELPVLENAADAFENPPSYQDSSLNAYRYEGLARGTKDAVARVRSVLLHPEEEGK